MSDLSWALGTILAIVGSFLVTRYVQKRHGDPQMSWKDFAQLVERIAPIIPILVPGIPPVLIPAIVHGIQVAEKLPDASGPEKKAAALEEVKTAIATANIVAKKTVVDPTAINAVSNGIDTAIGIVNLVKKQPVAPDADLASS